ncbi:MAG: SIP domain-containing protein [Leucobacter sp.]
MFTFDFDAQTGELALAAGTPADLPAIRGWLAQLPEHVHGQVIVESDEHIDDVPCPAGVSINRVAVGLFPGETLARAVDAWLEEWLWAEADCERNFSLWVGEDPEPPMGECWDRLDRRIARGHFVPAPVRVLNEQR